MKSLHGFIVYPSTPNEIGQIIELSAEKLKQSAMGHTYVTWKAMDIVGHFISEQVLSGINSADILVADITELNFNVTYEIGYAIGKSKRLLLTKNISLDVNGARIQDVGIFDTLGYFKYQNSVEFISGIRAVKDYTPIDILTPVNQKAPVYLVETPHKTDWSGRIVSRIKKAGYIFRTFDPNEIPRLSAYDAISQVAQSYGIVVPLLSSRSSGSEIHNLRGAFIAGLAGGMGKPLCIIQNGDDPVPIDYVRGLDYVRGQ